MSGAPRCYWALSFSVPVRCNDLLPHVRFLTVPRIRTAWGQCAKITRDLGTRPACSEVQRPVPVRCYVRHMFLALPLICMRQAVRPSLAHSEMIPGGDVVSLTTRWPVSSRPAARDG